MLRILAVGTLVSWMKYSEEKYSEEDKDSMMNGIFTRNMASSVKIELCFDGIVRVPLYFGNIRVYINEGLRKLRGGS